ncbi:MAG: type I polyketide synthase [Burkholderiales bacterium]
MKKKRVAIISSSCRLPGTTSRQFWNDLVAGKDLVTRVPPDRWGQEHYWHPQKNHPGTSYTFAAGTIGDISGFDAEFFGISPREAAQIDPQQRLLLELSWEALENAGLRAADIRGNNCGVFIGISSVDYSFRFVEDLAAAESAAATGTANSIAANRISYSLDLHGPSLTVDTACSSSLIAFHLACQSIVTGESTQALAGGVSLHMHPYGFVTFSKASMLSQNGRCNVFDAAGDGYVRSEGAGIFMLKDFDQAVADGNHIVAIVAGTATNSDGRKSGLTVPSVDAQVRLLEQAYAEAGISATEIDYIEAHGTGTAVGDPVETHALGIALGKHRPREMPLLIGSVKSNIGHLEAASGAAGLVKALHCIEHRAVPATIHLRNPNPNIRFDEWNLKVPTATTPLRQEGRLVLGVNSFGFGGANAHVILESPPSRIAAPTPPADLPVPLLLSGKSKAALRQSAGQLAAFLRDPANKVPLYDIAYTAAFHRDQHDHRAICIAADKSALAAALEAFSDDTAATQLFEAGETIGNPAEVAFVYSGNGSQWEGMGRELLESSPVFSEAVHAVDSLFRPLAGYSLIDDLTGANGAGRYALTEFAQPALFALQVGITQMLRRQGLQAVAVAGHSVGEVAAAWASGALSLEQAVRVIYQRSHAQASTRGQGQMTAVGMNVEQISGLLDQLGIAGDVTIAGINSSRAVTIAGAVPALVAAEAELRERRIFHRRLELDYAFHSAAMDPVRQRIMDTLHGLEPQSAAVPFHSSVTGARIAGTGLDADYWWRNIRETVQFEKVVASLRGQGVRIFIEIGPHPVLRGYLSQCLRDGGVRGVAIPTLMRGDGSLHRIWRGLCQASIAGAETDWRNWFPQAGLLAQLPNYPWQREHHWHGTSVASSGRLSRNRIHPLLGYRLDDNEWTWENELDTQTSPLLADHVIGETVVMPGTGYVEMVLAAANLWRPGSHIEIERLDIRLPLVFSQNISKRLRFSIDHSDGSFLIRSRDALSRDEWAQHASGRISGESSDLRLKETFPSLAARNVDLNGQDHDILTRAAGLDYGPAYRAISAIWIDGTTAYARFRNPESIREELHRTHIHPALLDCAFQLIIELLQDDSQVQTGTIYVPTRVSELVWHPGAAQPHAARATLLQRSPHTVTAGFTLFDADGNAVASIREARFTAIRTSKSSRDRLKFVDYRYISRPHPLAPLHVPNQFFNRLQKSLTTAVSHGHSATMPDRYTREVEPLLDVMCSRFAARALKSLASESGVLTEALLNEVISATPAIAPLLSHLLVMLQEDQALISDGNDWKFAVDDDLPPPEDIWNGLIRDYPDYVHVIHRVGRIGIHLADLLRGQRTPDQVLSRNAGLGDLAHQMLTDTGLPRIQQALSDAVTLTLKELPAGARLRVIEICANKPLFASAICGKLDFDRCAYAVTAITAAPSEDCLRLKENFPAVETRALPPGSLDESVIPCNELFQLAIIGADFETESDALFAISQARRMLAPGGVMIIVEQHPCRWMDLVFGVRPAWWSEISPGDWKSRHKPPSFWRRHARRLGLLTATTLDLVPEIGTGTYLLVAHAPQTVENAALSVPGKPQTWLLLADRDDTGYSAQLADQLARVLRARNHRILLATPASGFAMTDAMRYQLDFTDPVQFESLLAHAASRTGIIDGVVHLQGLAAAHAGMTPLLRLEKQVDRCASTAALIRACETTGLHPACWLLTLGTTENRRQQADPQHTDTRSPTGMDAALWGFGRTAMNEATGPAIRLVDIDPAAPLDIVTFALSRELEHPDAEQEIVISSSGERLAPRLRILRPPAPVPTPGNAATMQTRLTFDTPGQLRNLYWELRTISPLADDEIEIEVRATGLNFRDVMYTLGLLSDDAVEGGFAGAALGLEFSGVVVNAGPRVSAYSPGDRVLGFGSSSFSNRLRAKANAIAPIPAAMSFEAAATVPSAFFTVHYALNHLCRLQSGEKILIHGAAGGVGIAAIQMARLCGAEIFATAGSADKRDFLRLLGVDHVFDSRSLKFSEEIAALTRGKGVDVVLNSLAGEAINRNLRVLKPFGRFIELGKRDFEENTRIGLRPFRNNISYFAVDADQLMKERPELSQQLFLELMRLFSTGELHPLPYRSFDSSEIINAFRHMQQSRHIGKIVVTYGDTIAARYGRAAVRPRLDLSHDATYLVTGGLGGFGLKTAEWLVKKGARNLVLISRRGQPDPDAGPALKAMGQAGAKIHTAACDVTDPAALKKLFAEITVKMPPLRGVIHAAATIEDGMIRHLSADRIRRVLAPKILGAHHLHELTRERDLDFFVLYSSATTLFGNPGQAAYVAANAYLESFAVSLRAAGHRALCVRWGAIADAGFLARNAELLESLNRRMGGTPMTASTALEVLDDLILANRSGAGVLDLDWPTLSRFLTTANSPKFSEINTGLTENGLAEDGQGQDNLQQLLSTLPPAELTGVIGGMLKREIGNILRILPEKIDDHRLLHDIGFDSLMGVELVTAVETRFTVRLPVMAMSDSPTAAKLTAIIVDRLLADSRSAPAPTDIVEEGRQLAALHGDSKHSEAIVRAAEEMQAGASPETSKIIH